MQETQERRARSLSLEDPLGKEMATHFSILVWEIPWTEGAWWTTVHGVAKEWDMTKQTKKLIRLIMVRLL